VNAVLEFAAILNTGTDYNCTFELIELSSACSLNESLAEYFESLINWRTNATHRASEWHIRTVPLEGSTAVALSPIVDEWVFGMTNSPHLGERREWVRQGAVATLCRHLMELVGEAEAVEVLTTPPIWYEAHWRDVALSSSQGRWLLHFGVTD
jgi:hypothetical protein